MPPEMILVSPDDPKPLLSREVYRVLGVRVDALQIPGVVAQMEHWIEERTGSHYIAVTGMHGVAEAHDDPAFKAILNAADLVVPDGMPLVWIGRRQGHALRRRVYGPELMLAFCQASAPRGYRHFFYGGAPGVPEQLADVFRQRFLGLHVVGTYSPPFRPLGPGEDAEITRLIREAAPDVVWVGLSTPKQEQWMHEHRERLSVPVLIGVGAAFDFHTGRVRQAPAWMREHGLEWLFRLIQEPRRLWRRYIIHGAKFCYWVALELLGLKQFP